MTNRNTLNMVARTRIRSWLLVGALLAILGVITVTAIIGIQTPATSGPGTTSSAEQAEKDLTALHGREVSTVIEQFELSWNSLTAVRDPRSEADIVTDTYLANFMASYPRNLTAEPLLYITKSISVSGVRVLEFTSQRFEALACVTTNGEKVSQDGVVVTALPPSEFHSVYVFVFQDSHWKLANALGYFRQDDALRDWQNEPEWSKDLIGNFPNIINKDCLPAS
jgi:hypothetical protein